MIEPWYVTGFCDGEAAFTYSRASGVFNMYFSLRQREDNRGIVEEIHKFFDYAGYIYKDKGSQPAKNSGLTPPFTNSRLAQTAERAGLTKPSAYYRVSRIEDLIRIIEHFDRYPLQSKKIECYNIWKEMVLYKNDNWRSADYDVLKPLAEKLSTLNQKSRVFSRRPKFT